MARYQLVSVKFSRREHKKDENTGKLMYRDEDEKIPVYELKSYGIGEMVELTPAEAKRLRKDIKPIGGTIDQPTPIEFAPDESEPDDEISDVLAGNVDQVLAYIDQHADDEDTLQALQTAESGGKKRKKVLDTLNELLGE